VANPIWPRPRGGKELEFNAAPTHPTAHPISMGQKKFSLRGAKKSAFGKFVIGLVDAAFFEAQPEKLDEARCQQRFILYAGKYLP